MLQRVQIDRLKLKILHKVHSSVNGIASYQSDDLLVSVNDTDINIVNSQSDKLTDSPYDTNPYIPISVHVTKTNKVIVGAWSANSERGAVFVMCMNG